MFKESEDKQIELTRNLNMLNLTIKSFKKKGKKDKASLLDPLRSREKVIPMETVLGHKQRNGLSLILRVLTNKRSKRKWTLKNKKFQIN